MSKPLVVIALIVGAIALVYLAAGFRFGMPSLPPSVMLCSARVPAATLKKARDARAGAKMPRELARTQMTARCLRSLPGERARFWRDWVDNCEDYMRQPGEPASVDALDVDKFYDNMPEDGLMLERDTLDRWQDFELSRPRGSVVCP
jgi:hypothetical protein